MRSHAYMQAYEQPLPKVAALWPSTGTFYVGVVNTISLDTNVPFAEEGDVIHEFGHHVLFSRAESPIPNYSNGICDSGPVAGHCIYSPEEGVVSWTEGWPNFFAAVVHNQYNGSEQWGTTRYVFEQRQDTSGFAGQEDKIEGVIAAILWDIIDMPADDQFEAGSGRRDNHLERDPQLRSVFESGPQSPNVHSRVLGWAAPTAAGYQQPALRGLSRAPGS
jgi:hypothetical protein